MRHKLQPMDSCTVQGLIHIPYTIVSFAMLAGYKGFIQLAKAACTTGLWVAGSRILQARIARTSIPGALMLYSASYNQW